MTQPPHLPVLVPPSTEEFYRHSDELSSSNSTDLKEQVDGAQSYTWNIENSDEQANNAQTVLARQTSHGEREHQLQVQSPGVQRPPGLGNLPPVAAPQKYAAQQQLIEMIEAAVNLSDLQLEPGDVFASRQNGFKKKTKPKTSVPDEVCSVCEKCKPLHLRYCQAQSGEV